MTRYRAIHPVKLGDGTIVPAGAVLPTLDPRDLVRLRQKGAQFAPVEERRRIRVTTAFNWGTPGKMRAVEPGTELVVEANFARRMEWANRAKILGPSTAPVSP